MANSQQLRDNIEQHKVKNTESKHDDKQLYEVSKTVVQMLQKCFPNQKDNFYLTEKISLGTIGKLRGIPIENQYKDNASKPDGGIIWWGKNPLVITEAKRQGTNNAREKEGKDRQALGNAIERLGKNLAIYRKLYRDETIFPFICYCRGCDFGHPYILSKLYGMNDMHNIGEYYYHNIGNDQPFSCIYTSGEEFDTQYLLMKIFKMAINSLSYFSQKENRCE